MLLGLEEQVLGLDIEDSPADSFPCMPCDGVHSEMRCQLYALLLDIYFDEAQSLEEVVREHGPYGPYVFKLAVTICERLAEIEEDDIPEIVKNWSASGEVAEANFADEEADDRLGDFLFNLIHFCRLVQQQTVLSVFIMSDG